MKKYKLTDQNMKTYNGFQWKLNKEVRTDGKNKKLCNSSWLHYYHHPLLAILLNPIHANITNPRLFEVKALGKYLDDNGLKGGCTKMILVKELKFPKITLNQKIAFGILCSLEVYKEPTYVLWANNWLKGVNRTDLAAAAGAAYAAARAADLAAAAGAAYAAARAADLAAAARAADLAAAAADAARAAYAAAAYAARAAYAAAAAARAAAAAADADAAADAADAAARAAYAAAAAARAINLIKIAKKALKYK
jgi:hypothetical protein